MISPPSFHSLRFLSSQIPSPWICRSTVEVSAFCLRAINLLSNATHNFLVPYLLDLFTAVFEPRQWKERDRFVSYSLLICHNLHTFHLQLFVSKVLFWSSQFWWTKIIRESQTSSLRILLTAHNNLSLYLRCAIIVTLITLAQVV